MATLLVSDVKWDCDGYDPVDDCALPINILVVGAPLNYEDEEYEESLSCYLSDTYGFCHQGYSVRLIEGDKPGSVKTARIKVDAVMESP